MKTLAEEFEEIDKRAEIAGEELINATNSFMFSYEKKQKLLARYIKEIGPENIKKIYFGKNNEYICQPGEAIWD